MHVLVTLLSLIAAAGIWYMRIRRARDAAGELIDAAGKVKGAVNRRRFRNKVGGSVLTAIENPAEAAIVLMASLRDCKYENHKAANNIIRLHAQYLLATDDVTEAVTFADWAVKEVPDVAEVVRRLAPLWNERLETAQKLELLQLAREVAHVGDCVEPSQESALRKLRQLLRLDQVS